MSGLRRLVLALAFAGLFAQALDGSPKLAIRVSPTMSMAPAHVDVRATVQSDDDNRTLEVTAESEDFYSSSQLPLQGAASARIHEVRLNGLPTGRYEITAALVGAQGRRTVVSTFVMVAGVDRR